VSNTTRDVRGEPISGRRPAWPVQLVRQPL